MTQRIHGGTPRNPNAGGAYVVAGNDSLKTLDDIPQSSVGAPNPCLVATEHKLSVSFVVHTVDPEWDGTSVRLIGLGTDDEPIATVRFERPVAHFFGPPNDEAFTGHPLASRGLEPYGAYEVLSSSWIRTLEQMNSVHPYHRPEHFRELRHFVLSFHDTTFECIATRYAVEITEYGSVKDVVASNVATL
ncbi:MAG TPA: hypothetical protein PLB00_03510 [Pseudomonadota bacterium]|nr:hypothetical protein [Pseudomonadota bacterium]